MTSESEKITEKLLVNRYQLIELVGTGAMGKVYRAEDKASNNSNVAIKFLTRSLDDSKMIQRFQREATISALLSERSINIVKVTDYGVDESKVPFYVMEFLEGEDLGEVIHFHQLTLLKFLNFTRQICLAIETAHNGIFFEGEICPIIHRDLKPSNIFIVDDDEQGELVKVLDFGIAKLLQSEKEKTQSFMGTPKYCSPQQIQGEELDNRSDIYSLGVIMYEMLTKKLPFSLDKETMGEWYKAHTQMTPEAFPPRLKIPPDLQKLVMRCLAKSPNDRPQSIGEIIQILDNIGRRLRPKPPTGNTSNVITSPIIANAQKPISELEKIYLDTAWPSSKPLQKIVFPRLTNFKGENLPSLWAMLDDDDIKNRHNDIRYNKFLFQTYPYPMILWITLLYNIEYGPRWLPCYLDLKTSIGQQMANTLGDYKEYHVLLFSLDKPQKCQHILNFKVMLKQRTLLKQWASVAKMLSIKDISQSAVTKKQLKQDFEDLKPEIVLEITKKHTNELHS